MGGQVSFIDEASHRPLGRQHCHLSCQELLHFMRLPPPATETKSSQQ